MKSSSTANKHRLHQRNFKVFHHIRIIANQLVSKFLHQWRACALNEVDEFLCGPVSPFVYGKTLEVLAVFEVFFSVMLVLAPVVGRYIF